MLGGRSGGHVSIGGLRAHAISEWATRTPYPAWDPYFRTDAMSVTSRSKAIGRDSWTEFGLWLGTMPPRRGWGDLILIG